MRFILLSFILFTVLAGCGGGSSPSDKSSASVSITTNTLADAPSGLSYSQTLAASGGTGTYTWSVASGVLPPGLSLSSGGTISGTPTAVTTAAAGTDVYTFTVKTSDATRVLSIFTPTTGRMSDSTGKVYAEGLTFAPSQGVALTVMNTDSAVHTIQVIVANYDNGGKEITGSAFNMSPMTVLAGASTPVTNSSFTTYAVNNWRLKSVSIQ